MRTVRTPRDPTGVTLLAILGRNGFATCPHIRHLQFAPLYCPPAIGFGISKPLQFLAQLLGAHVVNMALVAFEARSPCFGTVQIPELQVATDAIDPKQATLSVTHQKG